MRRHNEWLEKHLCWLGSIGMIVYLFGTYFGDAPVWQPVLATSGILGMFFVFSRFCDYSMPQVVRFTGMSTLGIYAIHQPIIRYVKHIIEVPTGADVILTFTITYVISVFFIRIINSFFITSILLLGKREYVRIHPK